MEKQVVESWAENNFYALKQETSFDVGGLGAIRAEAFEDFLKRGFPSTSEEEYKYTNLSVLGRKIFVLPEKVRVMPSVDEIRRNLPAGVSAAAVFVDGVFCPELSGDFGDFKQSSGSVIISPFGAILSDDAHPLYAVLQQHFVQMRRARGGACALLNLALFGDGLCVVARKNAQACLPIYALFIGASANVIINPRVILVAEPGAKVSLVEHYVGVCENSYFTNAVTHIVAQENSSVEHFRVQNESVSAYHVSALNVNQHAHSSFRAHSFLFGGALVRNEVNVVVDGEQCDLVLNGVSVLSGNQHGDNNTVVAHAKAHSQSSERYIGVYGDRARGVFSGTIIVQPDAQKTNAIQSNASLLLSDEASIDSKPQLKIWADDVKCTHGATIGQLDNDALFYLRARGIPVEVAKAILIKAFAREVLGAVTYEPLRVYVEELIEHKFKELL